MKCFLLLVCSAGFLYIELYMVNIRPLYNISDSALQFFNISNITLAFGFVGMWAYYLNVAIYRAEIILQRKTKELAVAEQKAEKDRMQFDSADLQFALPNVGLYGQYLSLHARHTCQDILHHYHPIRKSLLLLRC